MGLHLQDIAVDDVQGGTAATAGAAQLSPHCKPCNRSLSTDAKCCDMCGRKVKPCTVSSQTVVQWMEPGVLVGVTLDKENVLLSSSPWPLSCEVSTRTSTRLPIGFRLCIRYMSSLPGSPCPIY